MNRFDLKNLHSANTARTYPVGTMDLRAAIEEAIRELPRWTLTHATEEEVRMVCQSRVFGFEDDVTVRLTPGPSGAHTNTRAEFESISRIGVWDFGKNGRNLKKLLAAIDRELRAKN